MHGESSSACCGEAAEEAGVTEVGGIFSLLFLLCFLRVVW